MTITPFLSLKILPSTAVSRLALGSLAVLVAVEPVAGLVMTEPEVDVCDKVLVAPIDPCPDPVDAPDEVMLVALIAAR